MARSSRIRTCRIRDRFSPGLLFIWLVICFFAMAPPCRSANPPHVDLLEIRGAIGPAVSDYVKSGLNKAAADGARAVILQMDTPGGLDLSMRDIIQAILASTVPVITYVAPAGSRAASAGTYILYASHVAAMAPATNLGAATPIRFGGLPHAPESPKGDKKKNKPGRAAAPTGDTLERKIVHDAAAYIKSLAERNGRNADWAVKAVREAVSLSAKEALALHVIDIVAPNLGNLLEQTDGRVVIMGGGASLTLHTANLTVVPHPPTWRFKLLSIISDPNVAYLLLLVGIYGLIFELANPGMYLPGVTGAVAMLLALYGFQILPINYSGLALIFLGVALLVAEVFVPSFGSLGIGGIISFAIGSLILITETSLRISLPLIGGTTILSALLLFGLVGRLFFIHHQPIRTGPEALIGMSGYVIEDCNQCGKIMLAGEIWSARAVGQLKRGDKVKVIAKEGPVLTVEKLG